VSTIQRDPSRHPLGITWLFGQGLIAITWLFGQGLIAITWLFGQGLIAITWLFGQGLIARSLAYPLGPSEWRPQEKGCQEKLVPPLTWTVWPVI
jgi:hypothetical protein